MSLGEQVGVLALALGTLALLVGSITWVARNASYSEESKIPQQETPQDADVRPLVDEDLASLRSTVQRHARSRHSA